MIYNTTLYKKVCNFCTIYIVLFVIAFLIIFGITSAFICFHWYLKRSNTGVNTSVNIETLIYRYINRNYQRNKYKTNKLLF